ncbi:MAG: hypothetical protein JW910_19120, partial [Anaerolineae bacterium]|nr:hypothetical protein [Anaerolineae bacterium]
NPLERAGIERSGPGFGYALYPAGGSGLRDLLAQREGRVVRVDPNSNLIAPRTVLPTLCAEHQPGECWLACAVIADPAQTYWQQAWEHVPELPAFIRAKITHE